MKKKTNITEKNAVELTQMLAESREQLRAVRFENAGARAKDSSAAKKNRAIVARVLTERGTRARAAALTPVIS